MQIERLRKANEGCRALARESVTVIAEKVQLHGKYEVLALRHGRCGKSGGELLGAAIQRLAYRAGELQAFLRAAAGEREPHDPALDAMPCDRHRMRAVGRGDDDQGGDTFRITLPEGERDHPPIGAADDRAQRLDVEMVDEPRQRFGLVVR